MEGLIGYQLRRASAAFMADFIGALGDAQLRPTQYAILSLIGDNPAVSQSALSRALAIKKANLVALIAELERRNLVVRTTDAVDRRVQALSLTADGCALLADWRAKVAAHERAMLHGFSDAERDTLLALLTRLWKPRADLI